MVKEYDLDLSYDIRVGNKKIPAGRRASLSLLSGNLSAPNKNEKQFSCVA